MEETKSRGFLKNSCGKIFLHFGREINSTENMKKLITKISDIFQCFITCLLAQMNTEAQFKILVFPWEFYSTKMCENKKSLGIFDILKIFIIN